MVSNAPGGHLISRTLAIATHPRTPSLDPRRSPSGHRRPQRGVQLHSVLGIAPSIAGHQPGMIVEEREQVGLVDLNSDTVQRIPVHRSLGLLELEPALSCKNIL